MIFEKELKENPGEHRANSSKLSLLLMRADYLVMESLSQFHYKPETEGFCFSCFLRVKAIHLLELQIFFNQHFQYYRYSPTFSNIYFHFRISVNKTTHSPNFPMHFLSKIPKPRTPLILALEECMRLRQKFFTDLVALCIEQEKVLLCQND